MKQLKRSKSLTELAIEGLREAIVTGQFRLGEPLSEIQLAASMGTSKTPVREALAQLRLEGLVTVVPQSGTFVFTLSSTEVIKLCEFRFILEIAALKLAYQLNRDEFVNSLHIIVENMSSARQSGDRTKYLRLDTEFHEQLFNYCNNQYLSDAYSLIGGKIAALRTHLSLLPNHTQLSFNEHFEFVDSLDNKDLESAKIIIEKHIRRIKDAYVENIEDNATFKTDRSTRIRAKKGIE